MNIKEIIDFIEKHGLVAKIIDKLLTPEMMRALGEGIAKGAVEGGIAKYKDKI